MRRKTHLALALFLMVLGLTLPGSGQEPAQGIILRGKADSIGEYVVELPDGHTFQRGDVVTLHRAGQQTELGEAFIIRVQGKQAVVSLKGDFPVRSGDTVRFVRRPSAVMPPAYEPAPEPPAAPSSTSTGKAQDAGRTLQDPNGYYSLKLLPRWKAVSQGNQPDGFFLAGPSPQQVVIIYSVADPSAANVLNNPEGRAQYELIGQLMQARDIKLVNMRDVTMLNRQGLRWEIADSPTGGEGYIVVLPGTGYIFIAIGLAPTPAGLLQTEAQLHQVQLR